MSTNSASPSSRRDVLPGGLFASRRLIRRTGGVLAIGVACCIWVTGQVLSWFLPDTVGGALSFISLVLAAPAMPILGIPTTGGTGRMFLALVASAAVWWLIGQLAAARVSRSPVVGIREWATAFLGTGIAIWVGSVAGLLLGAFALGAF